MIMHHLPGPRRSDHERPRPRLGFFEAGSGIGPACGFLGCPGSVALAGGRDQVASIEEPEESSGGRECDEEAGGQAASASSQPTVGGNPRCRAAAVAGGTRAALDRSGQRQRGQCRTSAQRENDRAAIDCCCLFAVGAVRNDFRAWLRGGRRGVLLLPPFGLATDQSPNDRGADPQAGREP